MVALDGGSAFNDKPTAACQAF